MTFKPNFYDKKDTLVTAVLEVLTSGIAEAKIPKMAKMPEVEPSAWDQNKKEVVDAHKKLCGDGYKYCGSETRETPLAGQQIVHNYIGDGHTMHMHYDANSMHKDKGFAVKHTKTDHQIGKHYHLQESVEFHADLVEGAVAVHTTRGKNGQTQHEILDNGKKVGASTNYDQAAKKAAGMSVGARVKERQPESKTSQSTHIHPVHSKPYGVKPGATKVSRASIVEGVLSESKVYEVGATVIPVMGPHQGVEHTVTHVNADGTYNIKPNGLEEDEIKYRLGSAKATHAQLTEAKDPSPTIPAKGTPTAIPNGVKDEADRHNAETAMVMRKYLAGVKITAAELENPTVKKKKIEEGKIDDLKDKMAAKKLDDDDYASDTPKPKKTLSSMRKVAGKSYGNQKEPEQKDEEVEVVQGQNLEQIDEISKKTLGSYVKKASIDANDKSLKAGEHYGSADILDMLGKNKEAQRRASVGGNVEDKSMKRLKGISKATDRLTKEEADNLGEKAMMVPKKNPTKEMKKIEKKWPKPSIKEAIGHIEKGGFHKWLGKKEGDPITSDDIKKGLAAGGHAAKMANFAKNAKKFHHEGVEFPPFMNKLIEDYGKSTVNTDGLGDNAAEDPRTGDPKSAYKKNPIVEKMKKHLNKEEAGHPDEAEDKKLIKKVVKKDCLKTDEK